MALFVLHTGICNIEFSLVAEPDDEWVAWAPKIYLSEKQMQETKKAHDAKDSQFIGRAVIKREK